MQNICNIFISIIFILHLTGCKSSGNNDDFNTQNFDAGISGIQALTPRSDILALISGSTYYLDANNGDDANTGSSESPWMTISYALTQISSGDGVIFRDGNYGDFVDIDPEGRTDYIIFINEEGASPEFTKISMYYSSPIKDAYLIFYGFKIAPSWVDPASSGKTGSDDPQYPGSRLNTYAKTENPVVIVYGKNIKFYNSEIIGTNKYLTGYGFDIRDSENIVIERCLIHRLNKGVAYVRTKNLKLYYSHIYNTTSSLIADGLSADSAAGSDNVIIEGNYGHDINWDFSEDYCPRASGQSYHGSFIAIRNPNIIIRNNIFHDGGNSSGIMTYTDSGKTFSNILIENNLIYDPHNSTLIRLFNIGENVIIRNNTFIGRGRKTDSEMKYTMALGVNPVASGYGSGLSLFNNIFVGIVEFDDYNAIIEGNNIYWAAMQNWKFFTSSDFTTSKIIEGAAAFDYFENGFFNGTLNVTWQGFEDDNAADLLNPPGHGLVLDLTLASGSEGINFGDPNNQPSTSLGSLMDGFIRIDGIARDENRHSAGCYETN